jgi:hypothetical protein
MLYLYNEYFSFFAKLKKLLGKPARGPEAVFKSLTTGLTEIGQKFLVNQPFSEQMDTVCVLSGVGVLKQAIKYKQQGRIKILVAGPNIVVEPNESNGILKSPYIDKILVPSEWVKDFYISLVPELGEKIVVWPAGVTDAGEKSPKAKTIIIYDKTDSAGLVNQLKTFIESQGYKVKIVLYGKVRHEQYLQDLKQSQCMIYLSDSESQGLAMFEAWMANVPTLVWNRGYMLYKGIKWSGNTSAPYLCKETGSFFKDLEEFKKVFGQFLRQDFSPRRWVKNNATDKISAENFLKIINA